MALEMIEGNIVAVVTYLKANLPAKVAALNSVYADDVTLDDITNVYDVEQVEAEAQAYPFIEVLGIRTDVVGENAASMRFVNHLAIMCTVSDDQSRSNLRRRCYRYARAIIELLKAGRMDPLFSGYTLNLASGAIDFNPLRWARAKSRVLGDVIIGCQFNCTEVYP